ncbi:MAG TPA: signal recognition particle-docking protein FtsY [Sphingomonadales bacterium]|nr:signal recognition particle-docking protein FtsY [Sphingomonadales bacterium]
MFKKFFAWDGAKAPAPETPQAAKPEAGWLSRLQTRLSKSSSRVSDGIAQIFTARKIDDAALDALEELLIAADLGVATAARVRKALIGKKVDKDATPADVRRVLADELAKILGPAARDLNVEQGFKPHVILMVGVNGTGKTTTIGKMAHQLKALGKSVMVAAADTFRAAAVDQLDVWAARAKVPIVKGAPGGDAASVAFAALDAARAQGADVLIIDTAGRLQNRTELMDELAKIVRVVKKKEPSAPHDTILVLDATTGQNALLQAEVFLGAASVSGLIMTKLDGTAKGGILVACTERFHLPIYGIGVGEKIEDLQPFDAKAFAAALTGTGEAAA